MYERCKQVLHKWKSPISIWKKCLIPLVIREMQNEILSHITGMAEIKKTDNHKCWWGCGTMYLAGTQNTSTWENNMATSYKVELTITKWPSDPISSYPREMEHMYTYYVQECT